MDTKGAYALKTSISKQTKDSKGTLSETDSDAEAAENCMSSGRCCR